MQEIELATWQEFGREVARLRNQYPLHGALLFRGAGDAAWEFTTTLERHDGKEMLFEQYYRHVCASEAQIQSFTRGRWKRIEEYPTMRKLASEYGRFDLRLWGGKLRALGYLAFLRHFGFPSPLLDWTRSPAIAGFFAFRGPATPASGKASVFVYCERPEGTKMWDSGRARIFRMGPHVMTARRHHLQQGEYTMCLHWDPDVPSWRLVPHERVFTESQPNQDLLWKFNLPWSERVSVLQDLDDYNVNAFSLFESDEALLETIALRRLLLEPAKERKQVELGPARAAASDQSGEIDGL